LTIVEAQRAQPIDTTSLPVVLNGAESPELVPDVLAARHFILALANDRVKNPSELSPNALGQKIGLTLPDTSVLIGAIDDAVVELVAVDTAYGRLLDATNAQRHEADQLKLHREHTLDEALRRLDTALSPAGREQLQRHLNNYVKPRIVIYGAMPQM
jgi:hypothetical protein